MNPRAAWPAVLLCAWSCRSPPSIPARPAAATPSPQHLATASGVVRGPDGEPVADALVVLVPANHSDEILAKAQTTSSNAAGEFLLQSIPPGRYAVTATAPNLAGGYVEPAMYAVGTSRELEISLQRDGITLSGTVTLPSGPPATSGRLSFARMSDLTGDVFFTDIGRDGSFTVKLPRARYFVRTFVPGSGIDSDVTDATDQRLQLALAPTFEPEPATARAAREWIRSAAVPLLSARPGNGVEDLEPLDGLVRHARVVAVGEAVHGASEFFSLKHRLLEYLVTRQGFTVFAIEANFGESLRIDDYVQGGGGDIEKALDGLKMWPWNTREVLDMIRWMREHNRRSPSRRVHFVGVDMQMTAQAFTRLCEYFARIDRAYADRLRSELAVLNTIEIWNVLDKLTAEEKQGIRSRLEEARQRLVAAGGQRQRRAQEDHQMAVDCVTVLLQTLEMYISGDFLARDQYMAQNLLRALDQRGRDAKALFWAHNTHIAHRFSPAGNPLSVGGHLRNRIGSGYLSIGQVFLGGSFRARDYTNDGENAATIRSFAVPDAPRHTLEAVLAEADHALFVIVLREPPAGAGGDWVRSVIQTRVTGAGFSTPEAMLTPIVPGRRYDALLFVRAISPSVPIEKR